MSIAQITDTESQILATGSVGRSLVLLQNLDPAQEITLNIDGDPAELVAGAGFLLQPKATLLLDGSQARGAIRAIVPSGTANILIITQ